MKTYKIVMTLGNLSTPILARLQVGMGVKHFPVKAALFESTEDSYMTATEGT